MSDKLESDILRDVLTPAMVNEIWSANFTEAIPFSLQNFSVGALLPAIFYMFRRGHRRGQGTFADTFQPRSTETDSIQKNRKGSPTVASVARVLTEGKGEFGGFQSDVARNILSDFLLTHCLENLGHESGRQKPVARAFPTHYQAAWIDLPERVSHLRFVPEFLVALLADQNDGEVVTADSKQKSFFRVGDDFTGNILLSVFGIGMSARELKSDLVDDFDEGTRMALDQLVTVRVARSCRQPIKAKQAQSKKVLSEGRGTSQIANQHSIAKVASRIFRDDTRLFLQAYGASIPRQSLTQMLESCMGLGLTNVLFSTASSLFHWESTGELPRAESPWPLMVDCSGSSDHQLRRLSEESMDESMRRIHRLPVIMMAIRILEWYARHEIRTLPAKRPDASARINLLGDILFERHEASQLLLRDARRNCVALAERFAAEETGGIYQNILEDDVAIANPVWRLAEVVVQMMGDKIQIVHILACLNSCMMTGSSNGLAMERRVNFQTMRNGRKTGMMKSVVLTDTMLDFLVHRHLRKPGKEGNTKRNPISFNDFVSELRARYGLLVDQAPPGQFISRELLQRNRRFLERRLRSLGLLMGVNDAESMKRLRPRFIARDEVEV
ncbi:MAG: hypothetical protein K9M08_07600 [Pirellula sp.]|nr:hypothetical protein [Pirellula sp.]